MNKKLIYAFTFFVVSSMAYAMASFFMLPGWNTSPGPWNNDNFIDSSFWPTVSGSGDIVEALYGTSPADLTAYTQYWSGTHTCTNMEVDVIQSGFNTIPEFLSGNTVYVLDEGVYTLNRTVKADNDCTALIGYQNVEIYSTVQIVGDNLIGSSAASHIIFDNLYINGTDDGSGSPHPSNTSSFGTENSNNLSLHKIVAAANAQGGIQILGSNIYGDTLSSYSNLSNGIGLGSESGNTILTNIVVTGNLYGLTLAGSGISVTNIVASSGDAGIVFSPGYTNISINSGSIDDSGIGLYMFSGSNLAIDNILMSNILTGVFASNFSGMFFTNYTHSSGSIGMSLESGNNLTLDNVILNNLDQYGISMLSVDDVNIQNTDLFNISNNAIVLETGVNISFVNLNVYDNGNDGFDLSNLSNVSVLDVSIYNNGGRGFELLDSSGANLTGIVAYNNQGDYGIGIKSDNVMMNDIQVYNNQEVGLSLGGNNNYVANIKAYNNQLGIGYIESNNLTVNNAVVYNNGYGIFPYETNSDVNNLTFSNILSFNNHIGVGIGTINPLHKGYNIVLHNAYIFNNGLSGGAGGGLYIENSDGFVMNNVDLLNNEFAILSVSGADTSEYYGQISFKDNGVDYCYDPVFDVNDIFAQTVPTCNVSSLDHVGYMDAGGGSFLGSSSASLVSTPGIMTCHQAVQAEDGLGNPLTSYPYCNERGYNTGFFAAIPSVQPLIYFEDNIRQQTQAYTYDGVSHVPIGNFEPLMYVGDYIFTTADEWPIGGYVATTGEVDTFLSGGLIYKSTTDPISLDIYLNTAADHVYTIEEDVDSVVNGLIISGYTGTVFSFDAGNGVKVSKTSFTADAHYTNYYGIMRIIDIVPPEYAFDKSLLTTGTIYPGGLLDFRLYYDYSTGSAIDNDLTLLDHGQTGLIYVGASVSPDVVDTWSGNTSLLWDLSGITPGTTGYIDVTYQVDPLFTGSSLTNTGGLSCADGYCIFTEPVDWFHAYDDVVISITQPSCVGFVGDVAPTQFDLGSINNANIFQYYQSSGFTVADIDTGAEISIAGGTGEYRINAGAWTSLSGLVFSGDYVEVRLISPLIANNATATTLTIGCVLDTFIVSTAGVTSYSCPLMTGSYDMIPETYLLGTLTNQSLSSYVTTSFVLTGVGGPTPVAIAGGEYRINGGPWMTVVGQADQGDTIEVRLLTSASYSASRDLTLTVGCVSDAFEAFNIPQPPTGGGGGGGGIIFPPDDCPDINGDGIRNHLDDLSPSRYDHICTGEAPEPTFPSAPIRDETDIGPAYYFMAPYELPKTGVGRISFK